MKPFSFFFPVTAFFEKGWTMFKQKTKSFSKSSNMTWTADFFWWTTVWLPSILSNTSNFKCVINLIEFRGDIFTILCISCVVLWLVQRYMETRWADHSLLRISQLFKNLRSHKLRISTIIYEKLNNCFNC